MSGLLLDISGPLTAERIVRQVKPYKAEGRILDVGSGKGLNVEVFRDYGYEAFGMDVRSAFNRNIREYALKATVVRMPFVDKAFDGVVESLMFSQAFEIEKWLDAEYRCALREVRRVLTPGGIFVSSWLQRSGVLRATGMSKLNSHSLEVGLRPLPSSDRQILVFQRPLE